MHSYVGGSGKEMLREERYRQIEKDIELNLIVRVSDLAKKLNVTEMTIRRDLRDLEERGMLVRVHGGARKKQVNDYNELSHRQKKMINVEQKRSIAKHCADLIQDKDIVFIGPGTTAGFIYEFLNEGHYEHIDIVTNSVSVFEQFKNSFPRFEIILVGGRYRSRTETFVGYFTNKMLRDFKVNKAFIGTNGIINTSITTANEEEGNAQKIILDRANETYILADSTKFGIEAFHKLYDVREITAIITDSSIDPQLASYYEEFIRVIK
ncbi:DeoR/GlpR family DNA-binding transcription regulator [Sporolactobacillus pectinivorans]|uniref:DeoR/GlpR family DNA-binding transcription regulator n=1 Tax=Sporolactobacillus pectinivorans TaxID=1591408 RepID=UPI001EFD4004|nr:DeoR/GlpR family DNA-binding transcription regulator [Sporolactobacillus pectinivorans]